jgi:hypothetical protein
MPITTGISVSTSTNTKSKIKALPTLDIVDTNYVAERDDRPGTNGTTLY